MMGTWRCAQYREPNPYARRLAAHALERLSTYMLTWLNGGDVDVSTNGEAHPLGMELGPARLHSIAYGPDQRLCFARGEHWREAVVMRPPDATCPTHLLKLYIGPETFEEEVKR